MNGFIFLLIIAKEKKKMKIIRKEVLEINERETDAMNLVCEMCEDLIKEVADPNLKKLAEEIVLKVSELWNWEE